MSVDEKWMRRALELAAKGRGYTSPNPMVGAVLVRGGRRIAEGYHQRYGQPHAEIEALARAGTRTRGSTLYVTLEPCSHWGKTPPCVDSITRAGIKRVVAAMQDPNPLVSGKGFAALKRHGISISKGILQKESAYLNRAFVTWVKEKRPFVTVKVASSLDGRTATNRGESKWITGEKARRAGHDLRAQVDAIAVGAGTVIQDNPSLTAHGRGRNPVRVIFAGRRRLPARANIFNKSAPTWVVKSPRGNAGIRQALSDLAQKGITHLLVEGGQTLQQSFFEAGIVDEVVWYLAPVIIGNSKHLKDAVRFEQMKVERIGPDLEIKACLQESFRRLAK